MSVPIYLGDDVGAAGYRLAGADVRTPAAGEAAAALAWARARASLVLLSPAVAAEIGDAALQAASRALRPLVVVVPDVQGTMPAPDLGARLRAQLGLDA